MCPSLIRFWESVSTVITCSKRFFPTIFGATCLARTDSASYPPAMGDAYAIVAVFTDDPNEGTRSLLLLTQNGLEALNGSSAH